MQSVYLVLFRLSWGFGRRTCKVGLRKLAERANLSLNPTRAAVRRLEMRGLIRNVGVDNASKNFQERGIEWIVDLPEGVETLDGAPPGKGAPPAEGAPPVEGAHPSAGPNKSLKENIKEEASVYEIRTIAARLFEVHRNDDGFDREQLLGLVRAALIGQGVVLVDATIEEAIRGMAV
jgi:DNA-binding Lrp family transcriptional regulator